MKKNNSFKLVSLSILAASILAITCQNVFASSQESLNDLATSLGWTIDHNPKNICRGYYTQPNLKAFNQPVKSMSESITEVTADQSTLTQNGQSTLRGHVVVTQSGRKLFADKAVIIRDGTTGQIKTIDLYQHVKLYSDGRLILGDYAHLNVSQNTGYIDHVFYRMVLADDNKMHLSLKPLDKTTNRIVGQTAWGYAKKVEIQDKVHSDLMAPSYSTCQPNTRQWVLTASKIKINHQTNVGTAQNVVLKIKQVPVFYWPYLNFPTSRERKSGFLFPILGFTSQSGAEFAWPYYINIAPNYDAVFAPTLYSKRGVLIKGNFRYLQPFAYGQIDYGFIPNDQEFKRFKQDASVNFASQPDLGDLENASTNRSYIHWLNHSTFNEHWSSDIDFSHVSDDYYFSDFGNVPQLISTNQLLQQGSINYASEHVQFSGMLQNFQTLHQVDRAFVSNLYGRLPELDLNTDYSNLGGGFDFFSYNQFVYFDRNSNPEETPSPPIGARTIIDPGLSWNQYVAYGFFIPSADVHMTNYALQNQLPDFKNNIDRVIPRFDLDSGLYFDRSLTLGSAEYTQTLEPRIYYLYVPFVNQDDIPLFESGLIPFTYDQLFRENRFTGADRIGDANQISLALSSRFINQDTGDEKIRLSIGQIYYFQNRKVTLCNTPECSDFENGVPGAIPENEAFSPIAGQVNYYFNRAWSLNGDIAWDAHLNELNNTNIYFQYRPNTRFLINFGYNFLSRGDIIDTDNVADSKNNLNQLSFSIVTPLTEQWSAIGAMNYNISQNHPQTYLVGLQYDSCCWAVRLAGGRSFTTLDQNGSAQFNNAVYLQFELKGLANIDPQSLGPFLSAQIPGYRDPFVHNSTFI